MIDLKIVQIYPKFKAVTCEYCGKQVVRKKVWKVQKGKGVKFGCFDCHPTLDTLI